MDKLEVAKHLLERVGMPAEQQSALCCLSLLAMAKLAKSTPYSQATNEWVRIHDIIAFISATNTTRNNMVFFIIPFFIRDLLSFRH